MHQNSTTNIRFNNENVKICLTNVTGWTQQLLDLALKLNSTPFGPDMKPVIDQMSTLGDTMLKGHDTNNNGRSDEALKGECGATAGYYYGYWMADMFIYPGKDRVPPPD